MANRLTRIYTRGGDKGQTSLASGERVSKADLRIEALGELDELNCQLGMLLAQTDHTDPLHSILSPVQHRLFDMGGEIAIDSNGYNAILQSDVDQLETELDRLNETLPPLKEFILPGGSPAAACCHQSRALCRRAERRLHQLADLHRVNPMSVAYLNRLSDLLFVCARILARRNGGEEILWQPREPEPDRE